MLAVQKLLNRAGIVPFMWYYRKKDIHQLLRQDSFSIVDNDVLYPAPVNYYFQAKKMRPQAERVSNS
jgi:hypothetical protein